MQTVKREYNEEYMLSAKMEAQQRINQIRMAIKMAVLKTEGKGDQAEEPEMSRMAELRRKLTEEEAEAKRQINRIRMAILRARRTEEQIVADRISQRARMAALRRKRSEQEMQTVREVKRAQMAAFRMRRTEEQAEADRRINRLRMAMLRAGRSEKQSEEGVMKKPYRRQLTEEELEVRRRINRVRVAMLRAQRTEEQIEAERRSQRARMTELRRRRSVEQIKNELESQRARMAALRRGRRSGEVTPSKRRSSLTEQMMRECKTPDQFNPYVEGSRAGNELWHGSIIPNDVTIEEVKLETNKVAKGPIMDSCLHSQWPGPPIHDGVVVGSLKIESSNIPYQVGPPAEACCQSPWCVPQISGQMPPGEMTMVNHNLNPSDKICRSVHCSQIPFNADGNVLSINQVHPAIKPIVIIKNGTSEIEYH